MSESIMVTQGSLDREAELDQIESIRGRMSANRTARIELGEREANIRDEYDLKKERYRELLQAKPEP